MNHMNPVSNNNKKEKAKIYEFDRYLVHYLLERCFWVSYGDSDLVSDLLSVLYEIDGHLGKIFCGHALPIRPFCSKKKESESENDEIPTRYPLKSTWNMELLQKQTEKPIDYFIKHAYRKKTLFGKMRFGEHWILRHKMKTNTGANELLLLPPSSVFFMAPEILRRLLEHGLFANADSDDEHVGRLLTGLIGIWATGGFDASTSDSSTPLSQNTAKVLEGAAMLLRAVKSVDISVLLQFQGVRMRSVVIPNIVNTVSSLNILPMLETRCGGLQKLQHLCRWQIRKQLYDCWQLPGGISFLPLPNALQQYLHLRKD
ncbi:hypothetical protein JTE90_020142 [Oedothorax gibbosus]|uniref:SOCS box domain-containing protein n=1 Tax=Oedothorax gibbosus TaxID=931172 RepID=A0AAV6U9M6_9ARAC|nr:hypothetical protein JTE90_020142 [Oedothorax gibbosus]